MFVSVRFTLVSRVLICFQCKDLIVSLTGLELMVLLAQPLECWDLRPVPKGFKYSIDNSRKPDASVVSFIC